MRLVSRLLTRSELSLMVRNEELRLVLAVSRGFAAACNQNPRSSGWATWAIRAW